MAGDCRVFSVGSKEEEVMRVWHTLAAQCVDVECIQRRLRTACKAGTHNQWCLG